MKDKKLLPSMVLAATAVFCCSAAIASDDDGDLVENSVDNCLLVSNPDQSDVDNDGWGDFCDADYDNNQVVNFNDYLALIDSFGEINPSVDLTGDGVINFIDLSVFRQFFLQAPGPAGYAQWVSNESGEWTNADNWFPKAVPHEQAAVTISAGGSGASLEVTYTGLDTQIQSLEVDGGAVFALDATSSSQFTVASDMNVDGIVRLFNGGLRVVNELNLQTEQSDFEFFNGIIVDARISKVSGDISVDEFEFFRIQNVTLAANVVIEERGSLSVLDDLELEQISITLKESGSFTNSLFLGGSGSLFGEGEIIYDGEPPASTVAGRIGVGFGMTRIIESGITIRTGQTAGRLGSEGANLIFKGTLIVNQPDHLLLLEGDLLSIEGSVLVSDGGRMSISGDWEVAPSGTIAMTSGSDVDLFGNWTNFGSITAIDSEVAINFGDWTNENILDLDNSSLELGGDLNASVFNQFTSNSSIVVTGLYDNAGAVLDTDTLPGASFSFGNGGTIVGGEVIGSSPLMVSLGSLFSSQFAVFDGVKLSADVLLSGSRLVIKNGLELNDATIFMQQSGEIEQSEIEFDGSQAVTGIGTVIFNCAPNPFGNECVVSFAESLGASVSIGADVRFETGTSGATFDMFCNFTNECHYLWDGQIVVDTNSVVDFEQGGAQSIFSGSATVSDGGTLIMSGEWLNTADSVFDVDNGALELTGRLSHFGTIDANNSDVLLGVSTLPWINQGTVTLTQSPLTLSGEFEQATLSTISTDSLTIIAGTLINTGQVLNLDTLSPAGLSFSTFNASIVGGTVERELTDAFEVGDLRLTDVDLNTDLTVSGRLRVFDTLTLNDTTIHVRSQNGPAILDLEDGSNVLGSGEILVEKLEGTSASGRVDVSGDAGQRITIGEGVSLNVRDAFSQIGDFSSHYVLQGLLTFNDESFGTLRIDGDFILEGTIESLNSSVLELDGDFTIAPQGQVNLVSTQLVMDGDWLNLGQISGTNSNIELEQGFSGDSWSNQGQIVALDGTISVSGTYSADDIAGMQTNENIILNGTLANQSGVLNTDTIGDGGLVLTNQIAIQGGVLSGSQPIRVQGQGATLDGVTLATDITIEQGALLTVTNDLFLFSGSISLFNAGNGATTNLRFEGSQTVFGNGTIDFTGTPDQFLQYRNVIDLGSENSILQIEEGVSIRALGNLGRILSGESELILRGDLISLTDEGRIRWDGSQSGGLTGDLVVGRAALVDINVPNFFISNDSMTDVVIDSTGNGVIEFANPIDFQGTLRVTLYQEFEPADCQRFDISTYPSFGTEFGQFESPVLADGDLLTLDYGATELSVQAPGVDCSQ